MHPWPRVLPFLALLLSSVAGAADWRWYAEFSDASSEALAEYHFKIHSSGSLAGTLGVPVRDATFELDAFTLHVTEGVIYPEPPLDGVSFGAFFVGKGEVSYAPEGARSIDRRRGRGH